jgi:hypothetical protein
VPDEVILSLKGVVGAIICGGEAYLLRRKVGSVLVMEVNMQHRSCYKNGKFFPVLSVFLSSCTTSVMEPIDDLFMVSPLRLKGSSAIQICSYQTAAIAWGRIFLCCRMYEVLGEAGI